MESQYIGFMLGGREFAVEIISVQEIIRNVTLTSVPKAEEYVCGVINLRGRILPVVDLKRRFNMPGEGATDGSIMVVNVNGATAGIQVDSITGVIPIPSDRIEPITELGDNMASTDMWGVARLDDRIILMPDLAAILPKKTRNQHEASLTGEYLRSEMDVVGRELVARAGDEHGAEDNRKLIAEFQSLLACLAGGDLHGAEKSIERITRLSDKKVYDEVGTVTRRLHESLKEFRSALDPRIKMMATQDMPEAADSLEHVIDLTEQAADKTMSIVEEAMADNERLGGLADDTFAVIDALADYGVPPDAIERLKSFRGKLNAHIAKSTHGCNEILLSQGFQDLTGQIIKRIIKLVRELEDQLIHIIRNFGVEVQEEEAKSPTEAVMDLKGPASSTRVDQGEIDDLLSSFGF
ncbi:MAG: protein phosphatase CheZ [Nitrospirae bacterium]|nr:protein phosphatase CheZ [Nitrospirota bacterium]